LEKGEKTVEIQAFVDRAKDVVIARGAMDGLFEDYRRHASEWSKLPEEPFLSMMSRALVAATLNLALLPPDEFTAWTLNIKEPPMNFFVCGDNNQFVVTGRFYTCDVKTGDSSRLFMESQRPKREPTHSVLDVEGRDVFAIFEEFYARSEQIPSRLFDLSKNEFVLVRGLPKADLEWLSSLDPAGIERHLEQELELIEKRSYRFHCGCNPKIILQVMQGMFRDKPGELFLGESQVEVHCPRCGRRWWVTREDFDAGPNRLGVC